MCTYVFFYSRIGLRRCRTPTRSSIRACTYDAGRKKSNSTEMSGKSFSRVLSTAAAAAAAANAHPRAPARTIAADQCRHRTELLETRWPNERAGGPTGPSTPHAGSSFCTYTCVRGRRKRWGWASLIVVQRAELATRTRARNGFSATASLAAAEETCFVCRIFFSPTPPSLPLLPLYHRRNPRK